MEFCFAECCFECYSIRHNSSSKWWWCGVFRFTFFGWTVSFSSIKSAAFSAIMMVDDIVLPDGIDGITEASTTRRFTIPFTLQNQISTLAQIGSAFSWVPYQQITWENMEIQFHLSNFSEKRKLWLKWGAVVHIGVPSPGVRLYFLTDMRNLFIMKQIKNSVIKYSLPE